MNKPAVHMCISLYVAIGLFVFLFSFRTVYLPILFSTASESHALKWAVMNKLSNRHGGSVCGTSCLSCFYYGDTESSHIKEKKNPTSVSVRI